MRKPIDEIRSELHEAENRLLLNVDGTNIDQTHLAQIYGPHIRKVKWGAAIPHCHMASLWRTELARDGVKIFYDPKLSDRAAQMPKTVHVLQEWGYDRISISAAGARVDAMIEAGRAATNTMIVVDLSADDPAELELQLDKLDQANHELSEGRRLDWVMCEAVHVAQVRQRGDWIITATGLTIPGVNPQDGRPRLLPADAEATGADEFAIGSAINFAVGMSELQAVNVALENLTINS